MRLHSLVRRRPSPAMIVASAALFVSLGGVGYAAATIPNNSIGSNQLKNDAVTYKKINPGSVGTVRANLGQLQARVNGTCGSNQAIGAVDQAGKVTCNATLPQEFGVTNTVAVNGSNTSINSISLPSGPSYLALANPTATVSGNGTAQHVTVGCTMTLGANSQMRSATFDVPATTASMVASVPLQVAGPAGTATVNCSSSSDATAANTANVSVTSGVNAIQTSSNN